MADATRRRAERRGWRHIAAFGVSAFVLCLLTLPVSAETIDRVLAIVGGQLITLTDVTAARELGLESADGADDPIGAILGKLIDRQLELVEVERYAPPEPTSEAIDAELARVRARFPTGPAFEAALARSGVGEAHLRESIRENLRIRAYLDQRFTLPGASPAGEQPLRQQLVDEWIAGLRRRAVIVDLYQPKP